MVPGPSRDAGVPSFPRCRSSPRRVPPPLARSVWERLRAARAREVWPGSRRGRAPPFEGRASRFRSRVSRPPSPLPLLRLPHPGGARSGAGPRDAAVSLGCRCELSLGSGWRGEARGDERSRGARGSGPDAGPDVPAGRTVRARACGGRGRLGSGRPPPAPPPLLLRARVAARPPLLTGLPARVPRLGVVLVATVPSLPSRRGPASPLSSPPPRRAHTRHARFSVSFLRNRDLRSDVATR